ncbi:MAG: homoserine kinase [Saprospiraceae bacterium]|uniref:Homoserine kinase n=1 Tax=Candidatus Opimibacter skivensis TaxID=2982028 RepID=A0A9D7STJ5_9BACT|nr:homoserine kinase [Candidatus Opimibacter skivensis]
MISGLKVIAPASVSNLACGFDTLGMAIDVPSDEIIGKWSDTPGIRILEVTGYKKEIPLSPEKNIAGITAMALLRHLGEEKRGLDLKIHKHIPAGSGLGSSASSATAAAVLINEMLNRPLEKRDLIPFALEGEVTASGSRHGDNIIPALIGGLILIRDIETYDYHRIYTPPGLFMAVLLPDVMISTRSARDILRKEVTLKEMVAQSANLGSFIIGMNLGDLDLISRSMKDHIIEPQRKHLIPYFEEVQQVALSLGALGCSISGAGPAIFALCQEKLKASDIANAMHEVYARHKLDARSFVGSINHEGTIAM